MKFLFFSCYVLFFSMIVQGQSVGIKSDGTLPNQSAMLDINNPNKGLLIPRVALVSETDVITIPNPLLSLLIYNTNNSLIYGEGYYYWNGSLWSKFATRTNLANLSWGIGGNASTNTATDFIGTTDNKALVFKTNSILSGKIDPGPNNTFFGQAAGLNMTTGTNNSYFGQQAGSGNTTGIQNSAFGTFALDTNSIGNNNSAFGLSALRSNSSGNENTALGSRALFGNKTGNRNVGIGRQSLQSVIDANDCIGIGTTALSSITTGSRVIAIGSGALQNATDGFMAIGIGYHALFSNSGSDNVAIGDEAMKNNTTGADNVAIGQGSLIANTTGAANISIGLLVLKDNVSGRDNTGAGAGALFSNTIGDGNTGIGYTALTSNTTGFLNTGVGKESGLGITTGSNNTAIGARTFFASGTLTNASIFGYGSSVSTSNTMSFGNESVDRWAFGIPTTNAQHAMEVGNTSTNGNGAYLTEGGTWTNTSDFYKKDDFTDLDGEVLLQKVSQLSIRKWRYKGTSEYHIGPVAQQFYQLFALGADDKGISTVDPSGIALAAIQEQQKLLHRQSEQIAQLEIQVQELVKIVSGKY